MHDEQPSIRDPKIRAVEKAWESAALNASLTHEELLNAAGHWLATVLLSIAVDEAGAHQMMNSVTESNHDYINATWPDAKRQRDKLLEATARRIV